MYMSIKFLFFEFYIYVGFCRLGLLGICNVDSKIRFFKRRGERNSKKKMVNREKEKKKTENFYPIVTIRSSVPIIGFVLCWRKCFWNLIFLNFHIVSIFYYYFIFCTIFIDKIFAFLGYQKRVVTYLK